MEEKNVDRIWERYNKIFNESTDFYKTEKALDTTYRDDPENIELKGCLASHFVDFLTKGLEFYNKDNCLEAEAIALLERQNNILHDTFLTAFLAFHKKDKKEVFSNLKTLLTSNEESILSEVDFIYLVVCPFKNAFEDFYCDLFDLISDYQVEEIVLEECKVLDEFYRLASERKTQEIIDLLSPIEGNYPDNILVNTLLGFEYYKASMWGNAIACTERVLDKPSDLFWLDELYFALGWSCGKIKDHKQSIQYYEESLELNPNQPNALNNLGYEFYLTRQYKKAAETFERCLAENRDVDYASNNYVKTLIASKRFADAREFVETGKYKISSYLKKRLEDKENLNLTYKEDEPSVSEVNDRIKVSSSKSVEFSSEEILEDEIVNRLEKGMKTFGRKLKMYRRKGKYGRQYTIPDGRIDVLAEDDEGNVYIIELKKNSGYDDAYDEHILKYFEWFDKHPITDKKTYGIICLNNPSKALIEKVRRDERVELYNYKVMFDKVE